MKRDFWGIDGEIWGWNRYIISNFHSLQKRVLKNTPRKKRTNVQIKGGGSKAFWTMSKKTALFWKGGIPYVPMSFGPVTLWCKVFYSKTLGFLVKVWKCWSSVKMPFLSFCRCLGRSIWLCVSCASHPLAKVSTTELGLIGQRGTGGRVVEADKQKRANQAYLFVPIFRNLC